MAFLADARAKLNKRENLQTLPSASSSSLHTYDPQQAVEFSERLNKVCAGEAWWTPLNPAGGELFARMADGTFLCNLLNKCEAGSVPESVLAAKAKKQGATTSFHNADTVTHFIAAARKAGLEMVGLGATDFTRCLEEHKEHLVMGALWQMLKRQLANEIKEILKRQQAEAERRGRKLANYSALMAMVLKDPEAYLVQWVNETMKAKGVPLASEGKGAASIAELSLGSSDTLLRLMHALDPASPATQLAAVHAAAPEGRAAAALDWIAEHAIVATTKAEDLLGSHPSVLMPFLLNIFSWASQQPGKEPMYVLRSHSHAPAGDAGRAVSASVCLGVYKNETEAQQNALVLGICALAGDRAVAPLEELAGAYAKATGDVLAVVTAALAPVAALVALGRGTPALPADALRERVELWVKGKPAARAAAAAAGAGEAAAAGGGSAAAAPEPAVPGLSPEELQAHYTRVCSLMKCLDNSKGSAVYWEVDAAPRF